MIFRVNHRRRLSGNKFLCEYENVLRNIFLTPHKNLFLKKSIKKGIDFDPFFCLYEKSIAAGDSKSLLYTLYSHLFFVLYSLCFNASKPLRGFETNPRDKSPFPSPSAYPAPKPILVCYGRHVRLRRCSGMVSP